MHTSELFPLTFVTSLESVYILLSPISQSCFMAPNRGGVRSWLNLISIPHDVSWLLIISISGHTDSQTIRRPFILTELVREWPAYRDWSTETLLDQYGDINFSAEAVDWPLKTYVDYMNDNGDESPLYLFDRAFVEKMGLETGKDGQYWAPDCFGEDLFSVLGDQRPDSRWLIVGPERSGSTFHKDPNATRLVYPVRSQSSH